jgi:hypothetical protein
MGFIRRALLDNEKNRIYLSAGQVSCAVPAVVHLEETPTEIILAVTGLLSGEQCTAQKMSLIGYVQLNGPVGGRRIVGNTAYTETVAPLTTPKEGENREWTPERMRSASPAPMPRWP